MNMNTLKSYFRFLNRNRVYTVINILGLSLSLIFLILLGDLVYRQTTVDNWHRNRDRIYLYANEECRMGHYRLGEIFKQNYPEVEDYCGVGELDATCHIRGEEVKSKWMFTGSNFFTFFDFHLLQGDPERVLVSPDQVVISRSFADKYYKDIDPVGQPLEFQISKDSVKVFTVSGVMENFDRSIFPDDYEALIHFENMKAIHPSVYSEEMNNAASCFLFLLAREGSVLTAKTEGMANLLKTCFWPYKGNMFKEVRLIPFSDCYYVGKGPYPELLNSGNKQIVWFYIVIGLCVLVFALFNYINLSVALTGLRAKEMATRRLLGSTRPALFRNLVTESILLTFVAFLLAFLIACTLQDKAVELASSKIDILHDLSPATLIVYLLFILITGTVAGVLPASVISNYNPIDIVRGTYRRKIKMGYSLILIVLQMTFSIVMTTAVLQFHHRIYALLTMPLGYQVENIWEVSGNAMKSLGQMRTFRDKVQSLSEVESVGLGYSTPVNWLENTCLPYEDQMISFSIMHGDSAYYNILDYHPIEDRKLQKGYGLNRQVFRTLGISEQTDEIRLGRDGKLRMTVRAVYPDLIYGNVLMEQEHPSHLRITRVDEYNENNLFDSNLPTSILVKFHGDAAEVNRKLERISKEITHSDFYKARLLSDQKREWYQDYERFLHVLDVFTAVALLIAVLGLLAMSNYFIGQRKREIAVRKVFGSTGRSVLIRLLGQYLRPFGMAVILSAPLSFWLVPAVCSLSGLSIGKLNFVSYVIALLLIGLICIVSIWMQSNKAAAENPIKNIKTE